MVSYYPSAQGWIRVIAERTRKRKYRVKSLKNAPLTICTLAGFASSRQVLRYKAGEFCKEAD